MRDRIAIVRAIVAKDLRAFSRDRFFVLISILGLVFYVALFWVLPETVDETINVGIVGPADGVDLAALSSFGGADQTSQSTTEGLRPVAYEDGQSLRDAVEAGEEVQVGIALPTSLANPTLTVYVGPNVPSSVADTVEGLARELAYALTGTALPVSGFTSEQVVLGQDRAGNQVSLQEKFRPLLALLVLLVESLSLGTLVASEIQARTVKAIAVTPARISDFLTAKALVGTAIAFTQVVLLMAAIRSLGSGPLILVVAVLLGSVLVTGFGLLAGSRGKDFIGIIYWSLLFLIPLMIPAFALLYPGTSSGWIRAMPSWPLARILIDVSSYGAGWAEVAPLMGLLSLWAVAILLLGWRVLERKVQTL